MIDLCISKVCFKQTDTGSRRQSLSDYLSGVNEWHDSIVSNRTNNGAHALVLGVKTQNLVLNTLDSVLSLLDHISCSKLPL